MSNMKNRFRSQLSKEHVAKLLEQQGITLTAFRKAFWEGNVCHQSLDYFDKSPRLSLPSLIKLCDILKLTPNEVLQISDKDLDNLNTLGHNLTGSLSHDLLKLTSELSQEKIKSEAQKEKIKYLEDSLKEKQDIIDFFLKSGQNSDK